MKIFQSIISLHTRLYHDREMIRTKTCPKCGSNRIAGPHRVYGQHHVRIDLPGIATATLESFTCADCGFTEFYADRVGLQNVNTSGRFGLDSTQQEQRVTRRQCPYCGSDLRSGEISCHECGQYLSWLSTLNIRGTLYYSKQTRCWHELFVSPRIRHLLQASIVALRPPADGEQPTLAIG